MKSILLAGLAAGLALSPAQAAAPDRLAAGKAWWSHIEFLAADAQQGRLTGSPGEKASADYVAAQFKALGLRPAGTDGYFQPVALKAQRVLAEKSSASLVIDGVAADLAIGPDLILSSRLPQPATIEAPLVFLGYGLKIPEFHHDDFEGVDLRGKIAVVINGGPAELSAPVKSHTRSARTWKALEAAGAVGLISIPTPKGMDIPWSRQMLLASQPGMYLADPTLNDVTGARFGASFNPAQAAKLFSKSGHDFAALLAAAEAGQKLDRFPMGLSLRATVATEVTDVHAANIVARLPGSDPKLAGETVVVSAHIDHLGVGAPINGDPIYHGAMDDASGVASVIEIAKAMKAGRAKPKRSVLFLIVTAEEKGLLGSRYFALRPTVPKASLVADVNMDMPLPLWPLKYLLIQGASESSLGKEAEAVAKARGYELTSDPYPDRNSFVRTDQYSFVRAGVPSLALKFGYPVGTPAYQIEKAWRAERYHSTADNLSQPVDLPAAADFNAYVTALTLKIANNPAKPRWNADSIFKDSGGSKP
ncbi:M28 family metallopeptidase [uncultured Caulobacter sp.]|uniref:M28 family metallopeptidase n=1 Tax=uncultured Caulobacter sp. TaxID=158749 RepID=UPI002638BC98|nr:M28 family metallopeptidase [uncultured Caulobacter sp.]